MNDFSFLACVNRTVRIFIIILLFVCGTAAGKKPETLGSNTKLYRWIPQNDLYFWVTSFN